MNDISNSKVGLKCSNADDNNRISNNVPFQLKINSYNRIPIRVNGLTEAN